MRYRKREKKILSNEEIERIKKNQIEHGSQHQYWKYCFEPYNAKKEYNLEDFLEQDPTKRNYLQYSNFETTYRYSINKDFYLHVPILACQALGTNEAVMIVEYARLNQNLPLNKYGFFLTSSKEIAKDTGLTYTQQATANTNLETWGYITSKTYKNPENLRFVRFNDDFAKKQYNNWKYQKGMFDFNIGRQHDRIKKKKSKD